MQKGDADVGSGILLIKELHVEQAVASMHVKHE